MGYNISDVGGQTTGGPNNWDATLDLTQSAASTVSGDFDVVNIFFGNQGEATNGYTFSALSNPSFGTLVHNDVTGTYTFTADWDAIRATGANQIVSFTVTGRSGGQSNTDTVRISLLICVARGTQIDTVQGPVAVEDLRNGDRVRTLDGPPQAVRWVGARKVLADELARDPSMYPIRIEPGALGEGRPCRPLLVSPQHRIYFQDWRAQLLFGEDQVLVPAQSLVNDHSIRRDRSVDEVEYFHILFDTHQIIFTDGAPTESFHPGAYALGALDPQVRAELFKLFPEFLDGLGYGDSARTVLRPWEGGLLRGAVDVLRPA